jgi:hypothetical protein
MEEKIKQLEERIQKEVWRIQMIDYPTPSTNKELHRMQKELENLTLSK